MNGWVFFLSNRGRATLPTRIASLPSFTKQKLPSGLHCTTLTTPPTCCFIQAMRGEEAGGETEDSVLAKHVDGGYQGFKGEAEGSV